MKKSIYGSFVACFTLFSMAFTACNDDISVIGDSIASSDLEIVVDSLAYDLKGYTVKAPAFESRSYYTLIGSINVPEYGSLQCSYVARFLPAESLQIPDSITSADVDSVKMIFSIPKAFVTGDTLAPQQLKVFNLTKQLPASVPSDFNPEGYYDPSSPLAVKSYTLSGYSYNDSTFLSSSLINLKATLPTEIGVKTFEAYESNPDIFIWPSKFANYWPGIYVTPSFGKGCVSPIQTTSVFAYFPKTVATTSTDDEGKTVVSYKTVADSVCMYTTAPEVLTSVNVKYEPSQKITDAIAAGKSIITTPEGYVVNFHFPAEEILKKYWEGDFDLSVINNMIFSIPAREMQNAYGISVPPSLLMVKTSEMDEFFSEGRVPDNKTSFYSTYSSDTQRYTFSSMREYIVELSQRGADAITAEDVDFTLVPVTITTEEYTDYNTNKLVTVVTNLTPYIVRPSMVDLDMENALVVFTYSNQTLR